MDMRVLRGFGNFKPALAFSMALSLCGLGALPAGAGNAGNAPALTVMTRNLDTGTDFGYFFGGPFPTPLHRVAATYAEVLASDPAGRAELLADEILASRPDLIALQEADLWQTAPAASLPLDPTAPPAGGAFSVTIDRLQELLDALESRGLHYNVVIVAENLDSTLPSLDQWIRFTDRDAILARADKAPGALTLSNAQTAHFAATLTIPLFGGFVSVPRSWESVDVTSKGRTVRFIATHLEAFVPEVTALQAHEIAVGPANTSMPVILAGDINSGPGGSLLAYQQLLLDGFFDTWTVTRGNEPGFTNPLYLEDPHAPNPDGPDQRIDLVLTRGAIAGQDAYLVGLSPSPSGLWASDHAGVVLRVQ
jgi:endonuclease/exonuclease/phosphatase family metal-dependent hydrolase